jgi:hypothetical protein
MGRLSEALNGYRGSRPTYLNNATRAQGGGGAGIAVTAEINQEAVEQINEALARLMITHPDTKKRIKAMLTKEAKKVRQNITKDVHNNIEDDPRKAYQAVKRSLYKKVLGFNVSILNGRKGSVKSMLLYHKPRKLDADPRQRGGNRRTRSDKTKAQNGYFGKARAFVLRFYNSGTTTRQTRFGNRGAMPSRRVFATSAVFQMEGAMGEISQMIEEIMQKEFKSAM